jgi:hypothetical protein
MNTVKTKKKREKSTVYMCLAMLVINIYVQKRKENNDKRLFLLRSDQKSVLERERKETNKD